MDNRYNRHNRRKYSLKVHIVLVTKYRKQLLKDSIADDVDDIANTYGTNMVRFCLNSIGRKGYFGQTDTLLAVLEKYRQRLYKSILKVRVNGERFTRLLPPPEGSGFPPMANERVLFMKESPGKVEIHELCLLIIMLFSISPIRQRNWLQ